MYLVIATTPALAQADGRTNPDPVSAYVVIIERNEAPFPSLINRFPIVSVVFNVPSKTISTIVLTAFADNRSLGAIKFPAALLITKVGSSFKEATHASTLFSICSTFLTSAGK